IARAHRVEGDPLQVALLLVQPGGLDVWGDLLERRHAGALARLDEDEMPAIARLDRALPRARLQLEQYLGKIWSELSCHLGRIAIRIIILEHEGVGRGDGKVGCIRGLPDDLRKRDQRAVSRLRPAVRGEVEVTEARSRRNGEAARILSVPGPQFG